METKPTFIDVLKVLAPMWGLLFGAAVGWTLFAQLWQIMAVAVVFSTVGKIYYRDIIADQPHFTAITWVVALFFFLIPMLVVMRASPGRCYPLKSSQGDE